MSISDEKIEDFHVSIDKIINEHGFAVVYVGGDEQTTPFGYTIGLCPDYGKEIVLESSVPPNFCQDILNMLADELKNDGEVTGKCIGEHYRIRGTDAPVRFQITKVPLLEKWAERHLICHHFYRINPEHEAIVVFLGDDENRLPGEEGYSFY